MRCLLLLLLTPFLPAMTCGPLDAPEPDACENPGVANIQSLEIGARYENGFLPLADGASVALVRGIQGADMVGVRFRLAGDSLPRCLDQSTTLRSASGALLSKVDVPLKIYSDSDDASMQSTHTLWLALQSTPSIGDLVTLEVAIADRSEQRSFTLVEENVQATPVEPYMTLAPGGSGVIELQLAEPAPPGGHAVMVRDETGSPLLASHPTITIPEGRLRHSLRIHLSETASGGPIYVMDAAGQTTVDISVAAGATPGFDYPLLFNEVYASIEEGGDDFNCDGVVDSGDSFVEIHNPNSTALKLKDLRIQQSSTAGDRLLYTFSDSSLGPGETILLMTKVGAPGCSTEDALPATNMLLESGRRLSLSSAFGTLDEVDLPSAVDQASRVRSPEFSGSFTLHSSVSASGAMASPGFRANDEPFAEE